MNKRRLLLLLLLIAAAVCLHAAASAEDGKLPDPQFTLDSDTVTRGDFLAVRITNLSDYKAYMEQSFSGFGITATPVYEPYGEWYDTIAWNGRGTIWVPTQNLNPEGREGGFTLHVNVFADSVSEGHAEAAFTVTEPQTGTLNFSIGDDEVVTREDYTLSVYAPGASQITIYDPYGPIYNAYGDSCMTRYGYNYKGEYDYYAKATYYDEETGEATTRYSDTLTVKVTAPYGDVTCEGVQAEPLLTYGEGLQLKVGDSPSGYESWDLGISRSRDRHSVWHSWGRYAGTITVPAVMPEDCQNCDWHPAGEDIFEPGELYDVELGLFRYGYQGYGYNIKVLVSDSAAPAEGLTMRVNDQTGTLTLPLNDMAHIEVSAPEDATALLIYNGCEWQFREGNYADYPWSVNSYNPLATYLFYAKYTADPITHEQVNQRDFDWNSLSWSGNSNVVMIDCLRRGVLPDPQVSLERDAVSRGEWLSVSVTNLAEFDAYEGIRFLAVPCYDPWGQSGNYYYYWDGREPLRVPTADLDTANKSEPFTLHVSSTLGTGWKEGECRVDFTVADDAPSDPSFDVYPLQVVAPDEVALSVCAPGASEVSIWQRDLHEDGTYHDWPMETRSDSGLVIQRGTFQAGVNRYYAAVKYPGDGDWTTTDPVEVTVLAPNGDQSVSLALPESVPFGEDLVLSLTGLAEDASAGLRVMRADDETVAWHAWGSQDTWVVPATEPRSQWQRERLHPAGEAVLEDGTLYLVSIDVERPGYNTARLEGLVMVGEGSLAPALSASESAALTSTEIRLTASAAGADRLTLDVTWDQNAEWHDYREAEGDSAEWTWSSSDPGEFHFALTAWMGETARQAEDVVVTMSAPYGNLDAPTLNGFPVTTPKGADVKGAFNAVKNATEYHIQLDYCPEGQPWELIYEDFRERSQAPDTSLSFPGELLSRAGVYRLHIHAHAAGWYGGHLDQRILVTETGLEQSLTLTVNGGSDEDIYLHQTRLIAVSLPKGVTAARLWSASRDGWDYQINDWDYDTLEWYDWGFHQGGDDTLIAQATTDPSVLEWLDDPAHYGMRDFDWSQVSWTMTSGEVTVHVVKYGDLDAPPVTFPKGTAVERGQTLDISLEPVENAYSYGVQIRRADDDAQRWLMDLDYPLDKAAVISVPTDGLEAGDYMVHIDPRCYGWHGDSVGYPFTVTQSAAWTDEPVFRVSATELLTQEDITFSIYAPGAEEINLRHGEDVWYQEQPGESFVEHMKLSWAQTYAFEAWALYPGEYEWRQIGNTAEVKVSAPHGALELTVTAPESILTSDTLTIDVLCDFKGTHGYTTCSLNDLDYRIVSESDEGNLRHITYQVDANTLDSYPHIITVYAFPDEPGYEAAVYKGHLDVISGILDATLTVDPNPAEIYENVHLHLSAPGAKAVAILGTFDGLGGYYEMGDSLDVDEIRWTDEELLVYGLYTTQDIDPEEGIDWEDVQWEGMSNSVLLKVNPPSAQLEALNVKLDSDTVKRGEKLKVSILNENPGLEVDYGAILQSASDGFPGFDCPWYGPESDGRTILVDTLEAEPGEYCLLISAKAISCHPAILSIPVTITEPDEGPHMQFTGSDVTTCDTFRVVGYAKGANFVMLDVSYENETWEPHGYATSGDLLHADVFAGEHPDVIRLKLTVTYPDGRKESLEERVTVTAPKGTLKPTIRLVSAWCPGQDMDFTVSVIPEAQYVAFVQESGAEEAVFAQFVPPGTPVKSFHLSKDEYAFEAGKTYEIRVVAGAPGYDGGEAFLTITRSASLATLNLPAGLKAIGEEAFAGVAAEKIVVPSGVTAIASNAFTDCPNLVELVLPEGVSEFAADALGTTGPVFVYGQAGGYLEGYAASIDNLFFIPVE